MSLYFKSNVPIFLILLQAYAACISKDIAVFNLQHIFDI